MAATGVIQPWRCVVCRTRGSVRFAKHAGVWEVVQAILTAHPRRSPGCTGGRGEIRAMESRP